MIKIGLIGFGGMGKVHYNSYRYIEGCQVTAICDSSPDAKREGGEQNLNIYSNLDDMLEAEEFDLIDICTPTFLHRQHVTSALNAGVHVLCEKPIALSLADAQAMFQLAEQVEKQLMIGHVLQFYPQTKVLKQLVDSGEYGRVIDASFLRLSAFPTWAKGGWLTDKAKSGLIPFDLHIHDLDLIVSLFGRPDSYEVYPSGRTGAGYSEHYRLIYHFGALKIMAEAAWYNAEIPFTATWRVYFENAVVECTGEKVIAYQFGSEPREFDTKEKFKIPTGINLPPTGVFYDELGYFINRIKETPNAPQYRKEEILTVVELLEEIVASS